MFTNKSDRQYPLYLGILHSSKQLKWLDPYTYQLTLNEPKQAINILIDRQKKSTKQTHKYLTTKRCRWNFLLSSFGFSTRSNFSCGKCDNCFQK